MKIRTALLSALTTLSLAAPALAQQAGGGGSGGTGGSGGSGGTGGVAGAPMATYFSNKTSTNFPADPCNDPQNPFKLGCYTNFLVISDLDGDGDPDIAFANGGGYYVPDDSDDNGKSVSGVESSVVYFNDGKGAFRDATATSFAGASSRLRQVAIADVDGDGDLDVYQPGGYGLDQDKLFIQTAQATFVDQAAARLPAGLISRAGGAHFGDLDGDGDMDLVVADWGIRPRPVRQTAPLPTIPASNGNTWVYLNDGTGVFTALPANAVPPPMDSTIGRTPIDIDLADVDGDFDLDILVNHRNGQSRIFLNDGKAKFSDGTMGNYPLKGGPYTYNVEACDFDEDGDLDLLLDNAGPATEDGNISQVLVNDGKGKFTDETTTTISGEPYADDNAVKCADINGDGHYDLLVASLTVPEKLLLNDGAGKFAYVEGAFPEVIDPTLGIDVADLDGDGKLDVVTGQGEGLPRSNLLYMGAGLSAKDKTPPKFRAVEVPTGVPGKPTVFRVAVTDSYTSETGEEVKEVYAAYTLNGGREVLKAPGKFVGGDLFRVEIPAQPAGTTIEVTPTAVDHVDLKGASEAFTLTLGTSGEGGAAGEGSEPVAGAAGEVGAGATGGSSPSAGAPAEGGEAGEGGSGGSPASKDDDDCSCSTVGRPRSSIPLLAGLGLAFVALRRKRNRNK